jgi:hypothetical protein
MQIEHKDLKHQVTQQAMLLKAQEAEVRDFNETQLKLLELKRRLEEAQSESISQRNEFAKTKA